MQQNAIDPRHERRRPELRAISSLGRQELRHRRDDLLTTLEQRGLEARPARRLDQELEPSREPGAMCGGGPRGDERGKKSRPVPNRIGTRGVGRHEGRPDLDLDETVQRAEQQVLPCAEDVRRRAVGDAGGTIDAPVRQRACTLVAEHIERSISQQRAAPLRVALRFAGVASRSDARKTTAVVVTTGVVLYSSARDHQSPSGTEPGPTPSASSAPAGVVAESCSFLTDGQRTAATLWRPADATSDVPAVVTGPGFGGVKEMLIPSYGAALAAAGIACLAFDPIGFGASDGARRQHVDPRQQVRSFRAALTALDGAPGIDATRLGVFGTSLSGAHALRCAADDPRVRCAVVIVPFMRLPSRQSPRLAARVVAEVLRRAARRPDRMIAVAGAPGEAAAMTSDGALEWLQRIAAQAPSFRTAVTVSSLLSLTTYSSVSAARRLTIPMLAIVAERDSITPGELVRRALPRDPAVEVMSFPETHFELFTEHLEETVVATTAWFVRHLADLARPSDELALRPEHR
jgi:uncharacterized protein